MTSPPARDARKVVCAGSLMTAVAPSPSRAHDLAPLTMLHHTRPPQPPPLSPHRHPSIPPSPIIQAREDCPGNPQTLPPHPPAPPPPTLPIHSSTTRTMMRSVDTLWFLHKKMSAKAPPKRPMTRARRPPAAPASRRLCRVSAVWSRRTPSGTVRPRTIRSLIRWASAWT
jgi:hypothetical protein